MSSPPTLPHQESVPESRSFSGLVILIHLIVAGGTLAAWLWVNPMGVEPGLDLTLACAGAVGSVIAGIVLHVIFNVILWAFKSPHRFVSLFAAYAIVVGLQFSYLMNAHVLGEPSTVPVAKKDMEGSASRRAKQREARAALFEHSMSAWTDDTMTTYAELRIGDWEMLLDKIEGYDDDVRFEEEEELIEAATIEAMRELIAEARKTGSTIRELGVSDLPDAAEIVDRAKLFDLYSKYKGIEKSYADSLVALEDYPDRVHEMFRTQGLLDEVAEREAERYLEKIHFETFMEYRRLRREDAEMSVTVMQYLIQFDAQWQHDPVTDMVMFDEKEMADDYNILRKEQRRIDDEIDALMSKLSSKLEVEYRENR